MATSTAQLDQADVFARDGFDVTGYINEMFPSGMSAILLLSCQCHMWLNTKHLQHVCCAAEDSLVGLDPLIGNLKQKVDMHTSSAQLECKRCLVNAEHPQICKHFARTVSLAPGQARLASTCPSEGPSSQHHSQNSLASVQECSEQHTLQ